MDLRRAGHGRKDGLPVGEKPSGSSKSHPARPLHNTTSDDLLEPRGLDPHQNLFPPYTRVELHMVMGGQFFFQNPVRTRLSGGLPEPCIQIVSGRTGVDPPDGKMINSQTTNQYYL